MLCKQCQTQAEQSGQKGGPAVPGWVKNACDRCGATVLTLGGVPLDAGKEALAQLARFGLGSGSHPLLEPKRERA
jgi:hypothetical protein